MLIANRAVVTQVEPVPPLVDAGVDALNRQIDRFNEWSEVGYNGPKVLAGVAGGLALTAAVAERAAYALHKRETSVGTFLGQTGLHLLAAGATVGAVCFAEVFGDELEAVSSSLQDR
jgi:hypothetical protein